MDSSKRLIIIDSNSLIHRAYHALPPLTMKNGQPVGAIYGFLLIFLKVLKELKPDFIAATFDLPFPTFRHQQFKFYKAKRPKLEPELCEQIPKIKEILKTFGISIFEKEGFEADDLIGTISKLAPKKQIFPPLETIILSSDSDTLQLIDSQTKVYALKKGIKETAFYDEDLIKEKYQGLTPGQLIDFKALRGDPSDNIAGVRGIGEKNALYLIKEFGSLDNLYQNLEKNTDKAKQIRAKIKEALIKHKEDALFSRELVQINCNAPIDFNLEECRFKNYNKEKIIETLKEFEFYSLIKKISEMENLK